MKSPKLHFHDIGLACWLLGIRTVEHLRNHPLRGALFETWVVTEVLKHRANQGERGGACFYRDRAGEEADLVVQRGDRLMVIEANASSTPGGRLLDGARRVTDVLSSVLPTEAVTVYAGETAQSRGAARLVPWSALHAETLT